VKSCGTQILGYRYAERLSGKDLQRRFVAARCAGGQRIDFRTYAGHDHMSVLASDSPLFWPILSIGPAIALLDCQRRQTAHLTIEDAVAKALHRAALELGKAQLGFELKAEPGPRGGFLTRPIDYKASLDSLDMMQKASCATSTSVPRSSSARAPTPTGTSLTT
jgi:hypothetical protein